MACIDRVMGDGCLSYLMMEEVVSVHTLGQSTGHSDKLRFVQRTHILYTFLYRRQGENKVRIKYQVNKKK